MKTRWAAPLVTASMLALMVVPFAGCGDDDDSPTDPNAGIQQVDIRISPGDQFVYNRWDLDDNNQKIGSSRRYEIEFARGVGLVGQYTDWFYRLGVDRTTNKRDTLFIRTETVTRQSNGSSYTKEVMAYAFTYKLLQAFTAEVAKLGNVTVPTIPSPVWDVIAKYYDNNGTAIPVGTEWWLTPETGVNLNFAISGSPVPVNAKIKASYAAREEKFMAGSKEVKTWKSTITATFNLLGSVNLVVKMHVWFSDDPDTQVRILQESSKATIPIVNIDFNIPGETQELVSWF